MKNSVELFGSIIDVESVVGISLKQRRFIWLVVWAKRLFYVITLALAVSVLYPTYGFHENNIFSWIIGAVVFYICTESFVDVIWNVDSRKIALSLKNGDSISSKYIHKAKVNTYIKYVRKKIGNIQAGVSGEFRLGNDAQKFMSESGYGGLWVVRLDYIMEVRLAQSFETYVGGLFRGFSGGVVVEIVLFDGNSIEVKKSFIIPTQDGYALRREVLERLQEEHGYQCCSQE